ncbi:unnamed protein product [Clonostachys rosea]|uniref:Uncharacterized protein n=1 Tax=Bionectria ochroleuca TaxID=29856 RepID=A0ABY6UPP3_BIOOC|nr:unnamed protein product [Clonostachys rosea]
MYMPCPVRMLSSFPTSSPMRPIWAMNGWCAYSTPYLSKGNPVRRYSPSPLDPWAVVFRLAHAIN